MIAHFTIGQVVYTEVFLSAHGEPAYDLVLFFPDSSSGFEPHEVIAKSDILLVCRIEIAPCQADIVNGIEDIGLADAIATYEAIHFFGKGKLLLFVIFEISKVDSTEKQGKLQLSTKLAH